MPDELGRPCMQHDPMPCGPHYSPIFQPDVRDGAGPTPPPVPAKALRDALDAFFEELDGDEPLAAGDCWGTSEITAAFNAAAPILLAAGEARGRTAAAADIRAALAEDLADSDVSSGEAIWEQGGYRQGLGTAADIAEGK